MKKNNIAIFVFGDIGRSPRMQYHSIFLSQHYNVKLIGYQENQPYKQVLQNQNIQIIDISSDYIKTLKKIKIFYLYALLRIIIQILQILSLFIFKLPKIQFVLIQNPPSIPVLSTIWLASIIKRFKIIIDFHNYGYTILKLNVKNRYIVKLAESYQKFFGRRNSFSLCVSQNMKENLEKQWKIKAIPLYDRPFQKITIPFNTQQLEKKIGIKIKQNSLIVVSSTSWTKDQDFSILLKSLQKYNQQAQKDNNLPFIYTFITGKGPQKESYQQYIKANQNKWKKIIIKTLWLQANDYPRLLASCNLGVCLHYSSSGVDLPMKVVDMFNAGLPVLAIYYQTIKELVKQDQNGFIFKDSNDLYEKLKIYATNKQIQIKLKHGVQKQKKHSLEKEWRNKFGIILKELNNSN